MSAVSVFSGEVILSANDKKRTYRLVTLANQMEVLLVSDPETEKASCCVDVNVGSLQDPEEAPGLAHFLEHLLFMGTETYPIENQYSQYLNEHGGSSNAYTASENTVYFFDVLSDSLEESLSIFSAFFVCPLFAAGSTEREINAVDSENSKNLQADGWRHHQMFKNMCREDHPYHSFSTGNKETLGKEPTKTREMCIAFHAKWYSASIMKAVLYGKEPLDVLQQWAEAKFSAVKNNQNTTVPSVPSDLFAPGQLGKLVCEVPVREQKSLTLYFPCPSTSALYQHRPLGYLSHLVGHEGAGSILSALKAAGLANGLSAYSNHDTAAFCCMTINIDLSDQGVTHYWQVLQCVFSYIDMLRKEGTQDWIYRELMDTNAMDFRFLSACDPIDYTTSLANNLHMVAVTGCKEHCVSGRRLLYSTDEKVSAAEKVSAFLECLVPDNCLCFLRHKGLAGHTDKKEKWYGTDYSERLWSAAERDELARGGGGGSAGVEGGAVNWASQLHLPKPNDLIPTDFAIRSAPAGEAGVAGAGAVAAPVCVAEVKVDLEGILESASKEQQQQLASADKSPAAEAAAEAAEAGEGVSAGDVEVDAGGEGEEGEEEEGEEEGEEEEGEEDSGAPSLILPPLPSRTSSLWHLQDTTWTVPKVNVVVVIESTQAFNSPLAVAQTELFAACLKEVLVEYTYYADCAGLYYDLSACKGGVQISFYGFHHKMPLLVAKVAEELKRMCLGQEEGGTSDSSAGLTPALFARMKEKTLRSFANFRFWAPYTHASMGQVMCCEEPRFSMSEKFLMLQRLEFQGFVGFCRQLLGAARSTVLVHGNATRDEAKTLEAALVSTLADAGFSPLPNTQSIVRRCVSLRAGVQYTYRQFALLTNPQEPNSACHSTYYWPALPLDVQSAGVTDAAGAAAAVDRFVSQGAMCVLLSHILSEAAFDQLRTKEQLGYIVWTRASYTPNHQQTIVLTVQSSHKDPEYLDGRIEAFLASHYTDVMSKLTPEAFAVHVNATVEKALERPKNLDEETQRHWQEVSEGRWLFDRSARSAQALRALTLESVLADYRAYLLGEPATSTSPSPSPSPSASASASAKTKFSSHYYGKGVACPVGPPTSPNGMPTVLIAESGAFKRGMAMQPVSDLLGLLNMAACAK